MGFGFRVSGCRVSGQGVVVVGGGIGVSGVVGVLGGGREGATACSGVEWWVRPQTALPATHPTGPSPSSRRPPPTHPTHPHGSAVPPHPPTHTQAPVELVTVIGKHEDELVVCLSFHHHLDRGTEAAKQRGHGLQGWGGGGATRMRALYVQHARACMHTITHVHIHAHTLTHLHLPNLL